jgi:hypothetical protein
MAVAAMATMLTVVAASNVAAQTLTEPNALTKSPAPAAAAKPHPAEHVKSCAAFGAGFVNVPGTDTCIKIGGSVTAEGTNRH